MYDKPFYISKESLIVLIRKYESIHPNGTSGKDLRGITFRLGKHNGEDALFPDLLYSDGILGDPEHNVIVPVGDEDARAIGCPYPPGYPPTPPPAANNAEGNA